jgi:hypothetical protein
LSTTCVSPPELEEKQLLLYLDGQANQETLSHLERCAYCLEKARTLDRFQKRLTSRLYRLTCPAPMELGEYHLRMLPASQMLIVAQHVRECPHCAREVSQLEAFLSDLELAQEGSLLGKAKVLIARLVGSGAEPGSTPAFSALRGESKGPLTFEADGMVIVLDVQPTAQKQVSILGQVATDDQDHWTSALVELQQASGPQLTASLDDLGAFRFDDIRPGATQITIKSLHGIIVHILNVDITL